MDETLLEWQIQDLKCNGVNNNTIKLKKNKVLGYIQVEK